MFRSLEAGSAPSETFYDGYVVNAILDACYKSMETKQWEPVQLEIWRGSEEMSGSATFREYDANYLLIKEEKMPDGATKLILKEKGSGKIIQRVG
jgi:hypothetical protein